MIISDIKKITIENIKLELNLDEFKLIKLALGRLENKAVGNDNDKKKLLESMYNEICDYDRTNSKC